MKQAKLLIRTALVAFIVSSTPANAQLLLDQSMGGMIGAGSNLGAASRGAVANNVVMNRLKMQGYTNIIALPNNPQQFTATSPAGGVVLLTIEPTTGQIISAVPQ